MAQVMDHEKIIAQFELFDHEARDLNAWGRKAVDLCAKWYVRVANTLGMEEQLTNRTLTLVLRPFPGTARTDPRTGEITFSSQYLRRSPQDLGIVIHELTHALQAFGTNQPFLSGSPTWQPAKAQDAWLTEGIAEYVRLTLFEPEVPPPRINPDLARYTDSYQTTATFLRWVAKYKQPNLVVQLNQQLQAGTYFLGSFQQITGQPVDLLWTEFLEIVRARKLVL